MYINQEYCNKIEFYSIIKSIIYEYERFYRFVCSIYKFNTKYENIINIIYQRGTTVILMSKHYKIIFGLCIFDIAKCRGKNLGNMQRPSIYRIILYIIK